MRRTDDISGATEGEPSGGGGWTPRADAGGRRPRAGGDVRTDRPGAGGRPTRVAREIASGGVAGAIATVAMTAAQLHVFPRILPHTYQRRFLPRDVLRGAQRRLLGRRVLHGEAEDRAVLLAHYLFGTSGGVLFSLLRDRDRRDGPISATVRGGAFGVAVWAASYEGWIPLTGVLPATTDRPPRKWPEPIAAHLVYGAALGIAHHLLRPRGRDVTRTS